MANTIVEPKKIEIIAKAWGKSTKPAIAFQLARLGLKDRGKLINSISVKIKKRFGTVESVRFEYLYYGLFHDVGAKNVFGKNVNLPGLHWKALSINPKLDELGDALADYFAETAIKNIEFSKTKS